MKWHHKSKTDNWKCFISLYYINVIVLSFWIWWCLFKHTCMDGTFVSCSQCSPLCCLFMVKLCQQLLSENRLKRRKYKLPVQRETCILGKAFCSKYFTGLVAKGTNALTLEVLLSFKILVNKAFYKLQLSSDSCGNIKMNFQRIWNLRLFPSSILERLFCFCTDGQTQSCKTIEIKEGALFLLLQRACVLIR